MSLSDLFMFTGNPRGEIRLAKGLASIKRLSPEEIDTMRGVCRVCKGAFDRIFLIQTTGRTLRLGTDW